MTESLKPRLNYLPEISNAMAVGWHAQARVRTCKDYWACHLDGAAARLGASDNFTPRNDPIYKGQPRHPSASCVFCPRDPMQPSHASKVHSYLQQVADSLAVDEAPLWRSSYCLSTWCIALLERHR